MIFTSKIFKKIMGSCLLILCIQGCKKATQGSEDFDAYAQNSLFQLAAPLLEVQKTLFKDSSLLFIKAPYPGAQVYYELNDSTEISQQSYLYSKPITLYTSGSISAVAFHNDFQKSETVTSAVFKIKNTLKGALIKTTPQPHPSYAGKGPNTLIDYSKGSLAFRNSPEWLGFDSPEVLISLSLRKAVKLDQITIGTLIDQDAWIFGPSEVKVYSNGQLLAFVKITEAGVLQKKQLKNIHIKLPYNNYQNFNIQLRSVTKIPEGHPGKGTQAWLFLDQILLD
jgi:hypothetical protein